MNELTGTIEMPLRGLTGKEGLSAYEVACKHGFTGTEEDWLETIVTKEAFEKVKNDTCDVIVVESDGVVYLNKNTRELVVRGNGVCIDVVVPEGCHIGWRCVINLAEAENIGRFDAGFDYPSLMFGSDATWQVVEAGKVYTLVRVNKNGNPNDFVLYELDNITRYTKDEQVAVEKAHSHDNMTVLNAVTEEKVNTWDKKISGERGAELFANALKGRKSGEVVILDDISPLECEISCKVKSKNLLNYPYSKQTSNWKENNGVFENSGITVIDNGDGSLTISGVSSAGATFMLKRGAEFPVGTQVTLSGLTGMTKHGCVQLMIRGVLDGKQVDSIGASVWTDTSTSHITQECDNYNVCLWFPKGADLSGSFTIYPQLECGGVATEWTPYVDVSKVRVKQYLGDELKEYEVGEDGKVDGLVSSEMTLMSDTEGVVIECEYNRDINKAFEEMCNAIISLGGNI